MYNRIVILYNIYYNLFNNLFNIFKDFLLIKVGILKTYNPFVLKKKFFIILYELQKEIIIKIYTFAFFYILPILFLTSFICFSKSINTDA